MYMVFYEAKSHRARKHRRPLPRDLKFSGFGKGDTLLLLLKYSDVILSSLKDPVPQFSCIWSSMKRKSSGSETSKAPTQGPEIFRVEFVGQSTSLLKVNCRYLVYFGRSGHPIFMYMFFYEAKSHRARKHGRLLPRGLKEVGPLMTKLVLSLINFMKYWIVQFFYMNNWRKVKTVYMYICQTFIIYN